jgi:hypothetical protein
MKTTLQGLVVLMIGVALTMAMGCATQKVSYSGFLTDYPVFEPGPEGGADFVYMKEGADFGSYHKVMMDEVVFYFKKDSDYKGIHPSEIQELTEAFNRAFIDALNDAYPLTDTPGPDVMRVRVGITEIKTSKPGVGTVTTIVPVGLAFSLIKKGAGGGYTGIGSASMEAELFDSMSNERIGAAIDEAPGGKLDVGKLTPAKEAFEFWAKRLKYFLDEAHGKN